MNAPTWDLSEFFEAVEAPAFAAYVEAIERDLCALEAASEAQPGLEEASVAAWAEHARGLEGVEARLRHVWMYLHCTAVTDVEDEAAQAALGDMLTYQSRYEKLTTRLELGLARASQEAFEGLAAACEEVAYRLRRLRERARWRMEASHEALASDLGVSGFHAWGQLYQRVTGRMTFTLEVAGEAPREVPLAWKRSLTESADGAVREAALRGSNAAIEARAEVFADALNAIAGQRLVLQRWRGVEQFLDPALFEAAITRETLETMLGCIARRRETSWRFLRLKARLLGMERLGFQDLSAPLPQGGEARVSWARGRSLVEEAFAAHHEELGAFARMAMTRRWVEAEARSNKQSGAFCATSPVLRQPRVYMTYNDAPGDVRTLAHELGHAFHSWVQREQSPWRARSPMTLAETASIFAETLLSDAVLARADASEQLVELESRLTRAATFCLNLPMRYEFEYAFYEARQGGVVSRSRINALLLEAQRACYGDCLDPASLDPWFWASKMHFFMTGTSFYNFPYTFGYLFSLGVFARARQEGPSFFATYVGLLRDTGNGTAEALAERWLGVDLRGPGFWDASLDLIDEDLERFEGLVGRVAPGV